ncbi:ABC transporter ATP-binding protein [Jiangella sp. DSM 45060]|uniref:ABC transporter ATP-binding protein n=1 Tax=Jiangella sp. DSM 45060 TaxID=1798224 RepID=UPI00087C8F90|nr:ABC transporter ATP-binding protein [Jiangella sp. DSM 45060]SDT66086.1 putative ABC transport system ATP-binding protein [Jiangella sp. DSM 45060]
MTDTTPPAAITAVGVTKTYGSGATAVAALADVTLQVPAGTWLAVMGPSGSGKSTLLHCLAGLERADAGRVVLAGTDITRAADRTLTRLRRTAVGFAFQNFNLVGSLTAAQNVALPLRLAGTRPSRARIRAALESVGLGDRARHRPGQLSGGQQQRVALARAIATRPAVLFADEPTGALDSAASRSVLGLLRRMVDDGQTVVMVTHDPAAAAAADSVVFLVDGGVVDRLERASAGAVAATLAGLERR